METVSYVLAGLMGRYQERVPDVKKILDALVAHGIISHPEAIENDHIAFRTLGVPQLGIQSFEKIFLHYGYRKQDNYFFPEKKLNAYWYAPPIDTMPRIFVSELMIEKLSDTAQQIIRSYTNEVKTDPADSLNLDDGAAVDDFLHKALWRLPSWNDYQALLAESEYAAWVIYNRYYLNHYTISVHNLPNGYDTLDAFNPFLESIGIRLNTAGGKIKQSPDGLLLQSATVAEVKEAVFAEGDAHPIAGSYVEFAERRVLPQFAQLPKAALTRQHRREGFEAGNADKIFESTYTHQTKKTM